MSIATELQDLNDNILDAYTAVSNSKGTVPSHKNTANLDTAIASIPVEPDVYVPLCVSNYGLLLKGKASNYSINWPTVLGTDHYVLRYAFYNDTRLTSFSMPNSTGLGDSALSYGFSGCSNLTSVDLGSLVQLNKYGLNYAFENCVRLTSVNLSSLKSVYQQGLYYAFKGCTALTSINLSSLTTLTGGTYAMGYTFSGCTSLTSVNLSSLSKMNYGVSMYYAFQNCSSLRTLSFPALTTSSFNGYTNHFSGMLSGCSSVTVHFPLAVKTLIEAMSGYPSFGGTSTTVLFDL